MSVAARRLSMGVVIPAALALLAIFDVAGRVIAPGAFIRSPAYRAAILAPQDAPFRGNLHFIVDRIDGDIASSANLPPVQQLGPLTFSTDAIGFRATPGTTAETADVLVAGGRSFLFGAALSDEDTLPSQLAKGLGRGVYNAGRWPEDETSIAQFENLLRLVPRARTVVLLSIEREDLSADAGHPPSRFHALLRMWRGKPPSPLRAIATRLAKRIQNGVWLPNRYAGEAVVYRLADGRRFLVRADEQTRFVHPPDAEKTAHTAAALAAYAKVSQAHGLRCIVVLIPDKLTVYAIQIDGAPPESDYLQRLEKELRGRGIEVVNAAPLLRHEAEQNRRLLYYLDDSHWTPAGVSVTANAIVRAMHAVQ